MSVPNRKAILAAQSGDRTALRELFDTEVPKLNAFCNYLVSDKKIAEEVLQQALLQGIENLHQLDGDMKLTAWLKTIARNIWLKSHRRKKFEGTLPQNQEEDAPGSEFEDVADPTFQCPAEMMTIRSAFSQLDDDERAVLVLVDIEEQDYREAAKLLGISEAALRSRLHRARDALRKLLISKKFETND